MRPYARYPTRNGGVFFCFLFFLGRVGPNLTSTGCMQKLQYSRDAKRERWWGVGGPEGHKHNSQLCDNMLL